jgi:hypothetical protein
MAMGRTSMPFAPAPRWLLPAPLGLKSLGSSGSGTAGAFLPESLAIAVSGQMAPSSIHFDQINLLLGERFAFAGHEIIVALGQRDAAHHLAFGSVADDESGAGLAPFERRLARIEPQLALLLFRAVAFDAVLLEEQLNVFGEIHLVRGGKSSGCAHRGEGHEQCLHSH